MGLDGRCRVASIVGRQRVPTSRDATAGMHPPRFLSCKANVIAQESTCWAEAAKVWSRKCLRPDRDSTAICLYPDLHCSGPRFDHRGKPLSASSMLTQINPPLLETDWNHSSSSQDRLLPCSRLTQTTLVLFKTDSSHSSCSQDCFKSLLLFLRLTLVTPLLKADSFFLGVCPKPSTQIFVQTPYTLIPLRRWRRSTLPLPPSPHRLACRSPTGDDPDQRSSRDTNDHATWKGAAALPGSQFALHVYGLLPRLIQCLLQQKKFCWQWGWWWAAPHGCPCILTGISCNKDYCSTQTARV